MASFSGFSDLPIEIRDKILGCAIQTTSLQPQAHFFKYFPDGTTHPVEAFHEGDQKQRVLWPRKLYPSSSKHQLGRPGSSGSAGDQGIWNAFLDSHRFMKQANQLESERQGKAEEARITTLIFRNHDEEKMLTVRPQMDLFILQPASLDLSEMTWNVHFGSGPSGSEHPIHFAIEFEPSWFRYVSRKRLASPNNINATVLAGIARMFARLPPNCHLWIVDKHMAPYGEVDWPTYEQDHHVFQTADRKKLVEIRGNWWKDALARGGAALDDDDESESGSESEDGETPNAQPTLPQVSQQAETPEMQLIFPKLNVSQVILQAFLDDQGHRSDISEEDSAESLDEDAHRRKFPGLCHFKRDASHFKQRFERYLTNQYPVPLHERAYMPNLVPGRPKPRMGVLAYVKE